MKDSFILYHEQYDIFKELTDEEAGALIKAIYEYEIKKELPKDKLIKLSFLSIKQRLDKNREAYYEKCQKNQQNGKLGGRPKNPLKPNGFFQNPTKPKKPDTDTDIDIELSKDNIKEKYIKRKFVKPTLDEVKAYCAERNNKVNAKKFIDYYNANGWKVGRNAMKDWKACVRNWERNDGSFSVNKKEVTTQWLGKDVQASNASDEEQKEIEELLGEF